ncbi:MAG: flagellar biosynthesis anti-sigma factor FlgM [Thermodesulfobacteriota bacterium]
MQIKDVLNAVKGYEKPETEGVDRSVRKGKAGKSSARSDSVRISREGRLFARALREAQESPEVRRARVNEIKEQVETGTYVIDTRKTAAKIIEEDLDLLI